MFLGGARDEREAWAKCKVRGIPDAFELRSGRKILEQGRFVGWVEVTRDQLAAYAASNPVVSQAVRAAEVASRDDVVTTVGKDDGPLVIVCGRLHGDQGHPPDRTRWLVLSQVSSRKAWPVGVGGSTRFEKFAAAIGVQLPERAYAAKADYLGGHPLRTAPAPGCLAEARGGGFRLLDPKSKGVVLEVKARDLQAIALGDHDRMKTLLARGSWAATGAGIGAISGAGADTGLLLGALGSFLASSPSRNQFVVLAARYAHSSVRLVISVEPGEARMLVGEINAQRHAAGLAALPESPPAESQVAVPPMPQRADTSGDPFELIERLGGLRDRGLISQEEFQAKRDEILKRI